MKTQMNPEELKLQLTQFTGTEHYYNHNSIGNAKLLLTDGCQFLRVYGKCYWLFDIISSYQPNLRDEEFQVWKLSKQNENGWIITAEDGNENKLVQQEIPFSDFPLDEVTIFLSDGVALLPSEN